MSKLSTFTKSLFLLLFLALSAFATQAQEVVSIQGTLKDANGKAVSDGSYSVDFALYNSASATTHLWTETATVEVIGGIYSHNLGSETPLNGDDFLSTVYLGVTVGGFELLPRTMMTYAPYTLATSYASSAGSAINADTATIATTVECSGALGDIKYSILNPTQFAAVNGDCWVAMDGTNHAGSALMTLLGTTTVPDMSGLFIRAQEYNDGNDPNRTPSSPIATLQQDELESHSHSHNANGGNLGLAYSDGFTTPGSIDNSSGETNVGNRQPLNINNTGGDETRPKNMNFYIYIRIN